MSIWTDMQDRGTGDAFRAEDDSLVYTEDGQKVKVFVLTEGMYRDIKYIVETDGVNPVVAISMIYEKQSRFAGFNIVILSDGTDRYEVERIDLAGRGHVMYFYKFNQNGDTRKYKISEMVEYAKKFIDIILKSEEVNLGGPALGYKVGRWYPEKERMKERVAEVNPFLVPYL